MSKETNIDLHSLRKEYEGPRLLEEEISDNPFELFSLWFQKALQEEIEPNAMVLATVDKDKNPNARVMLLKEVNKRGFVFYTNYQSKKGKELEYNPKATILFFWQKSFRQVRILGNIEKLPEKNALEYFYQRPYESQIAAYVSKQSEIIENRKEIEEKFNQLLEEYKYKKVPFPKNWGGYILIPLQFEFWQGRPARFHDRILYFREGVDSSTWKKYRLYP